MELVGLFITTSTCHVEEAVILGRDLDIFTKPNLLVPKA